MTDRTRRDSLYAAACAYIARGWSVIPVWGDADANRPKQPAIKWQKYIYHRATESELAQWFLYGGALGIGIVTGAARSPVVLDFDDPTAAADFAAQFPELTETYTVTSAGRGLPHYYYYAALPSRQAQGVDLQATGRYIIAPPTVINGTAYAVASACEPKTLTQKDSKNILEFIKSTATNKNKGFMGQPVTGAATAQLLPRPLAHDPDTEAPPTIKSGQQTAILKDITAEYTLRTGSGEGRNNTAYRLATRAIKNGLSQHQIYDALKAAHIHAPAPKNHPHETVHMRRDELRRTIRSAAGNHTPRHHYGLDRTRQLHHATREALIQRGLTVVARVADMAYFEELSGQTITEHKLYTHARKHKLGRTSVRAALQLFTTITTTKKAAAAPNSKSSDVHTSQKTRSQTVFVRDGKKRTKFRGRPAQRYRIPTRQAIARYFGVKHKGIDLIPPEALQSSKSYRLADERAFLTRAPGIYSRVWRARRLGLCARSVFNYDLALNTLIEPQFYTQSIFWRTVDHIPPDDCPIDGVWLEIDGERYAARRWRAIRALRDKRKVCLVRQLPNHYSLPLSTTQES